MISTLPNVKSLLLAASILASRIAGAPTEAKSVRQEDNQRLVFAHYMVGVTDGQTAEKWASDVAEARAAGIDGFALNAGAQDKYC